MTVRAGIGWQTTLADLSLILFMVTASAASQDRLVNLSMPSLQAEPLAVYRVDRNAPPLDRWLADQPRDPRQLLTIHVPYASSRQSEALNLAGSLARMAGAQGVTARIVVEPGEGAASATLAFDQPLAQSLLGIGETTTIQGQAR